MLEGRIFSPRVVDTYIIRLQLATGPGKASKVRELLNQFPHWKHVFIAADFPVREFSLPLIIFHPSAATFRLVDGVN